MRKFASALLISTLLLNLCACAAAPGTASGASSSVQSSQGSAISQIPAVSQSPAVSQPVEPPEEDTFSPGFPEELKQYVSPLKEDVRALAMETKTIRYYFMASGGLFMNEGQTHDYKWGDACLVVFPNGQTMLIDTARYPYTPILMENLRRMGIDKLDYIMLSHSHEDHTDGIVVGSNHILDNFEVGLVYYWDRDPNKLENTEKTCQNHNVPYQSLTAGDTLDIGEVHMEVLWSGDLYYPATANDVTAQNCRSLIVRFDYKEHSSLFTGDLYRVGESQVIEFCGTKLDVDLLKVPHHGQDNASGNPLINAVSPEIAVSTGYIADLLVPKRYTKAGAQYFSDFKNGYVTVYSDGTAMTVETAPFDKED